MAASAVPTAATHAPPPASPRGLCSFGVSPSTAIHRRPVMPTFSPRHTCSGRLSVRRTRAACIRSRTVARCGAALTIARCAGSSSMLTGAIAATAVRQCSSATAYATGAHRGRGRVGGCGGCGGCRTAAAIVGGGSTHAVLGRRRRRTARARERQTQCFNAVAACVSGFVSGVGLVPR